MARGCAFTVSGLPDSFERIIQAGEEGQAIPLALETVPISGVSVKAKGSNVGVVYVGGPNNQYYELYARETVNMGIDSLSKVYFRGGTAGDGVCWLLIGG